jgi:hypothetical protein
MPEYKLLRNGLHDKALALRTKIQVIGGGFGNGKTTVSIIKALQISQDYPGANILMLSREEAKNLPLPIFCLRRTT